MASDRPKVPERTETLRNALRDVLRGRELTLRELSQALGASERDLLGHLQHLERSLVHGPETLVIEPACCLACGFRFDDRARLGKPGRCPACRATRIAPPRFSIVGT
jgi:predicted Zn-ribbon and HTH transcriptional regulator